MILDGFTIPITSPPSSPSSPPFSQGLEATHKLFEQFRSIPALCQKLLDDLKENDDEKNIKDVSQSLFFWNACMFSSDIIIFTNTQAFKKYVYLFRTIFDCYIFTHIYVYIFLYSGIQASV